jgi:hypothetical protein
MNFKRTLGVLLGGGLLLLGLIVAGALRTSEPSSPGSRFATVATPVADSEACQTAADCVRTTWDGCCSCCDYGPPRAVNADWLDAQRAGCQESECSRACEGALCPPKPAHLDDDPRPVLCQAGRCELLRGPLAAPIPKHERCARDADCLLTTFPGCCADCPYTEPWVSSKKALGAIRSSCDMKECPPPNPDAECGGPPLGFRDDLKDRTDGARCVLNQCLQVVIGAAPPPQVIRTERVPNEGDPDFSQEIKQIPWGMGLDDEPTPTPVPAP